MQRVFISHTTRDNRDLNLAHKIANGLRLRGAQAWIAPTNIPVGSEWRKELVSGLMDQATHFFVILSAASIQSEWVLEEIRLAKVRHESNPDFKILPIKMGDLTDFEYAKFINEKQSIPYSDYLREIMDSLAKTLGLRPSIPNDFTTRIDELTKDFVGRDYVFETIRNFLIENTKGYLRLKGDPGVGKSAIMAEFVNRTGHISFFINQAQGINTPQVYLKSICTQLIQRYDLPYNDENLTPEATSDGAFFDKILQEAARELEPSEKLVIVVDALDELDTTSQGRGTNILYLPQALPESVYFILSSRDVSVSLTTLDHVELYDLMKIATESRRDIKAFLTNILRDSKIQHWIKQKQITDKNFVVTLCDKSENNFMYLKYVINDIRSGRYEDLSIENLPKGLKDYYEKHWERMGMIADPLPMDRIRIVYILCEIRQPVSRALIADFTQREEIQVQQVIDQWQQFLSEVEEKDGKRYSLYHKSFRDFLHRKDIVQAAGITIEGINALIADNLMDTWDQMKENF